MNKKAIMKSVMFILIATFMLHTCPHALAHTYSQDGILAKTYHPTLERYCVGGEKVGWWIDEEIHTNGTTLTYSFSSTDPYFTDEYRTAVIEGAELWNGIVDIINITDGTGTGKITTTYIDDTEMVSQFFECRTETDTGHLVSWTIEINRAKTITPITLAHEFGHAIGLNDLYESYNSGKLMYWNEARSATGPIAADAWGTKVITGVHSSHTWVYKYHSTNSVGNLHVKSCSQCNGWTTEVEQCTYNATNVCTKCNIPYGVQPYSVENPQTTS